MAIQSDPEGIEKQFLHQFANFTGGRLLEVGCGDGRMTWMYANSKLKVVGIDPHADDLAAFVKSRPAELSNTVTLSRAECETLPFRDRSFDLAILAWSL